MRSLEKRPRRREEEEAGGRLRQTQRENSECESNKEELREKESRSDVDCVFGITIGEGEKGIPRLLGGFFISLC